MRHAGLFASATLIGAQPGLESEPERAARRVADERWCRLLEDRGIAAFVDEWESVPLFRTQATLAPEVLLTQRQERLRHDPRELARSLRLTGLGAMPPYWNDLERESPVSTTLMVGSNDEKFSAIADAHGAPLAGGARREPSRLRVITSSWSDPDAVARAISRRARSRLVTDVAVGRTRVGPRLGDRRADRRR